MGTYTNLLQVRPTAAVPAAAPMDPSVGTTPPASSISQTAERTEIRSEVRTEALPLKRPTRRYSFEFYDDQIVRLKQLKRAAEDRGERMSLSDLARTALDTYLRSQQP